MSVTWEHRVGGRWTPYDDSTQTKLEDGFQSGLRTVEVDNDCSVTFTNSAMHNASVNKYHPVRRIDDAVPNVPVCVVDGYGKTQELGRYTSMQISTWPKAQSPWFRPQGDFYLDSEHRCLIDLPLMRQINLETGERLRLVGPVKIRAPQFRPPIVEGIMEAWSGLYASQN